MPLWKKRAPATVRGVAQSETRERIIADGMEPREVRGCVVDGVWSDRFYRFPAPGFVEGARARFGEIVREPEQAGT